MKKLVIVLGTQGAGKTSVVDAIKGNKKYTRVNLGDIMLSSGIKKNVLKDRDEIRYLDNDTITDLRTMAVAEVGKMDGCVILETQPSIEQHGRFFPGLPHYMMNHLKHLNALFYIDADTNSVLERRKKDTSRKREMEEAWLINTQRDINLAILSYYATELNIPLYVINNEEGQLQETRKQFMDHLKDAFGEK